MMKILLIYDKRTFPLRKVLKDHLLSFERYIKNSKIFYFNCAYRYNLGFLSNIDYDLIIFHWSFAGVRCETNKGRIRHLKYEKKISSLKNYKCKKIIFPQDEFTSMDLLCNFINDFKINIVFSVAPETEWEKIYKTVNFKQVKFVRVLTGYLDNDTIQNWKKNKSYEDRNFDVGYRVVSTAKWGRFNLLKQKIADIFINNGKKYNLRNNIKVGDQFFKLGEEWLKFLSDCRFTIGVEGGSFLLDWDGSLSSKINEFIINNPSANYDTLERNCIPKGKDGEIKVVAISPRHLEACLTKTAQILVEGEYNNILLPNIHFIPLKKDFSNIEQVIKSIKDKNKYKLITERAFKDIVTSKRYTYENFIRVVLKNLNLKKQKNSINLPEKFIYNLNLICDFYTNLIVYLISFFRMIKKKSLSILTLNH